VIALIHGLPDGVVGLEAVGEVSSADSETVANPVVERALGRHERLRLLHVLDDRFIVEAEAWVSEGLESGRDASPPLAPASDSPG
jgi:hypothetical protein